jgi:DNA sulfur modification protein DndB
VATYIPAMRARFGETEYFVTVLTLGEAARLVDYVEQIDGWTVETPSELKVQRKLNLKRVEREMVPYLVATDDHFYSALTVELRRPGFEEEGALVEFTPENTFPGGIEFGTMTLDGTELLYALDGQHRLKSIELAIRQRPELAREHISLIVVPYRGIKRSQTLFSDLNRNAKAPSKSVSLLFSHRDPFARVAKAVADRAPLLQGRVNMETTSLSANAKHFITLSTLYEMVRSLSGTTVEEQLDDAGVEQLTEELRSVLSVVVDAIPSWQLVEQDEEHPAYLRQRELSMHGVGQRAIAEVTARARRDHPDKWQELLKRLSDRVDWRLTNPDWQGIALQGGRVNNTSTSIRLLSDYLADAIGLSSEGISGRRVSKSRAASPLPVAGG